MGVLIGDLPLAVGVVVSPVPLLTWPQTNNVAVMTVLLLGASLLGKGIGSTAGP